MVKCVCCDADIDVPKIDPKDLKTMPCHACEAAIQECLDSFRHTKGPRDEEDVSEDDDMVAYLEDDGEMEILL